jgi:hypothetical protein
MSSKQTNFIGLSNFATDNDFYTGGPGSGAIVGNSFTFALMLQPFLFMDDAVPAEASECLVTAVDPVAEIAGFSIIRIAEASNLVLGILVGERPAVPELISINIPTPTVIGRPVLLHCSYDSVTEGFASYINGGLVSDIGLAAPFTPANTAALQIGGWGTQGGFLPAAVNPCKHTQILGFSLAYRAMSNSDIRYNAALTMSAHDMVAEAIGPGFDHVWSVRADAARSVPSVLTDRGVGTPLNLTISGNRPTGQNARFITDVGFSSPAI